MMRPEDFAEIVRALENDEAVSAEQVRALVHTVQRMDLQLLIGQNALQLAMENMTVTVPALAEAVMQRCGRTDKKIKKKIAEMAGAAVGDFELSLQSYLANAMLEAARLLDVSIEELVGLEEGALDEMAEEVVAAIVEEMREEEA